jgi:hypothetical protein
MIAARPIAPEQENAALASNQRGVVVERQAIE